MAKIIPAERREKKNDGFTWLAYNTILLGFKDYELYVKALRKAEAEYSGQVVYKRNRKKRAYKKMQFKVDKKAKLDIRKTRTFRLWNRVERLRYRIQRLEAFFASDWCEDLEYLADIGLRSPEVLNRLKNKLAEKKNGVNRK